jgi:hypothetical protein
VTSGWARHDSSGFQRLGLNDREELHYELLGLPGLNDREELHYELLGLPGTFL